MLCCFLALLDCTSDWLMSHHTCYWLSSRDHHNFRTSALNRSFLRMRQTRLADRPSNCGAVAMALQEVVAAVAVVVGVVPQQNCFAGDDVSQSWTGLVEVAVEVVVAAAGEIYSEHLLLSRSGVNCGHFAGHVEVGLAVLGASVRAPPVYLMLFSLTPVTSKDQR